MKKITLQQVITGLLAIAILFIVFTNIQHRNIIKDINKDRIELQKELYINDSIIEVLNSKIEIQNKQYFDLLDYKSKTKTIYEIKFKELNDVSIVSDDSIMQYISSKIHNQF